MGIANYLQAASRAHFNAPPLLNVYFLLRDHMCACESTSRITSTVKAT